MRHHAFMTSRWEKTRHRLGVVGLVFLGLLVAGGILMNVLWGDDDEETAPREAVALAMRTHYGASLQDQGVSYEVFQAEFQDSLEDASDDRLGDIFVIQVSDPVCWVVDNNPSDAEGTGLLRYVYDVPLTAYGAAVEDTRSDPAFEPVLASVDTFILSYRDAQETVVEIPKEVMDEFVRGVNTAGDLREQELVTVTGLTIEGLPPRC